MKTTLHILLFSLISTVASAHVELGPNGGRLLDLSKDKSVLGEVTVKGDKFHVALFDKDKKPMKVEQQSLTATGGTREKPEKLSVEKSATGFTIPLIPAGQWLIVQYKDTPDAKAVTARLHYDMSTCGECKKPEWLCACHNEKADAKK